MSLTLLDWRRQVAALYAAVRAVGSAESGWQLWTSGRARLFRNHPDSPLAQHAAVPVYHPYDPLMRFEVPVLAADPERIELATGTDGMVPLERIGRVDLSGLGSLDVWWLASYGGGLFLPMRDRTCGRESYGGGRYVLDTVKGADLGGSADRLVVDLNFAYSPSCAYDPSWACPLPQAGNNRLDVPVYAGELAP
jgi:uncharacterized protein (DUF1684 family)